MAETALETLAKTDRNPIQEGEYQRLLTAQGTPWSLVNGRASVDGFGTGGNAADLGSFNQASSIANMQSLQQKAVAPALASLEATRPEISQKYATERERLVGEQAPLNERYAKLVADITKNKESSLTNTSRGFNQEMAARGISPNSGYYGQELARNLNPINEQYTSLGIDANMNHEDAMRAINNAITGLVPQETSDLRAISQAIADMMAGSSQTGITQGLQVSSDKMARDAQERQFNESVRQFGIEQALAQAQIDNPSPVVVGGALVDPKTGRVIYSKPESNSGTGFSIAPVNPAKKSQSTLVIDEPNASNTNQTTNNGQSNTNQTGALSTFNLGNYSNTPVPLSSYIYDGSGNFQYNNKR